MAFESKVDLAADRELAADINDKLLLEHRGVCPGCDGCRLIKHLSNLTDLFLVWVGLLYCSLGFMNETQRPCEEP